MVLENQPTLPLPRQMYLKKMLEFNMQGMER